MMVWGFFCGKCYKMQKPIPPGVLLFTSKTQAFFYWGTQMHFSKFFNKLIFQWSNFLSRAQRQLRCSRAFGIWPVGSQVFWADGAAQRGPPCIAGFSWGYFLHHASVLALGTSLLPMPRHSQWHGEDREPPSLGSQVCEIYRRNEWSKLPLLCCCFSSFSHHTHQPLLFSLSSEEPSCALSVHSDKVQPLLPHSGLPSTPDDPARDCFAQ